MKPAVRETRAANGHAPPESRLGVAPGTARRVPRPRQRGVAIVLAMSVVALATLTATALMVTQSTWARQLELQRSHLQSQLLLQTGLDWARAVLSDDRRLGNVDHLGEPWALRLPSIPIENGSLEGRIEDQQGRFNLNNLVKDGKLNPAQLQRLRRLLSLLSLPAGLADALADWIDADSDPLSPQGAEDAYYLALQPPYRAANRMLTDTAELAMVRGFDAGVRARLRPYVSALPAFTPINVNTAPAEVISAGIEGLNIDNARTLVAQRDRIHFRTISDFNTMLPRGLSVPAADISVSSDFFVASMRVKLGGTQALGSALLARSATGWPAVVWRRYP